MSTAGVRNQQTLDSANSKASTPAPVPIARATQMQPSGALDKRAPGTCKYPTPISRELRGFALDPSLRNHLDTAPISLVVFKVPWEALRPGPTGEYLEVIDYDPASKCFYEPIDLDNSSLLAQQGYPPSEGVPQFHQQMVYAVSSLTVRHFEQALGRVALWRPGPGKDEDDDSHYVGRLRVYPHALREANAYYSPQKIALLFGYYAASDDDPADHIPSGIVFTCLSHDVVAHETTHALLDGMHRSFTQPTNPDMQAFHEAFADIVAMFQHFTYPDLVRHQLSTSQGDLRTHESLLSQLAGEFGRTTGKRSALRDAIGQYNPETQAWEQKVPDPGEYERTLEPHERGAILVAAVFDAFLSIYQNRTSDLRRLASGGSGILPFGALHPDLVARLSEEVSKAASHVLNMCIRALDYCPPIDLTFGEYLRALITADRDLVRDDDLCYRVAFIEAFRRRGLYPRDLRALSEESLAWRGPEQDAYSMASLSDIILRLRKNAEDLFYAESREKIFRLTRSMRIDLHEWFQKYFDDSATGVADARYLGLKVIPGQKTHFEVRFARVANRVGPDGNILPQFVIGLLQKRKLEGTDGRPFWGGSTIIADLKSSQIRYCIRKDICSNSRVAREAAFHAAADYSLRDTYFADVDLGEPFAMIHRR